MQLLKPRIQRFNNLYYNFYYNLYFVWYVFLNKNISTNIYGGTMPQKDFSFWAPLFGLPKLPLWQGA